MSERNFYKNNYIFQKKKNLVKRVALFHGFANLFNMWLNRRVLIPTASAFGLL